VLFTSIEAENMYEDSNNQEVENSSGEKEIETEYQTTCVLETDFFVYDLNGGNLVFNCSVENVAEETETRTTRTGFWASIIDNLLWHLTSGAPAEIKRDDVLKEAVEKLAADIKAHRQP
jgi:hypothetical protein